MNKKAAIGLSINTLVVIIISLVILAGGISLLYKFIGGADDLKSQLDEQTKAELERLLVNQGKQVALPLHVADVYSGEQHVFGLGILNIGGEDIGNQFSIMVGLSKATDGQNNEITLSVKDDAEQWYLFEKETMIIEEGEHRKESIHVSVPNDALKGQYIFNVKVLHTPGDEDAQYGNTQKFYVNVK